MFPKQTLPLPGPSAVCGRHLAGRENENDRGFRLLWERRKTRSYVCVGDAVTSLGISLEGLCSFWLTKLEPQQSLSCEKIMSSWIFPFKALLWAALLLLSVLGEMPSFYLDRGCHRQNEIRTAARSRSLGFFVGYGCVEIICPLLCENTFLLQCEISFRALNK